MRTVLSVALCAATMQAGLFAQTSPENARQGATSEANTYRIAGVVVNANSGAPLDHVDVTITLAGAARNQAAMTTAEDGGFAFDGLKAGKYSLVASRRGYVTSAYDEHQGFFSTAIVAGPGLDTTHLRFAIMPTAILSGTVIDDSGEPVSEASVTLFRQNSADSQNNSALRMGTDTADEAGNFEFTRLGPGTYFVSASATPWYAFHPQPKRFVNGVLTESQRSPLDVAYPTTFYADATDSGAATPIPVRAGDHPQINVTMHAVPAVQLHIKLPQPAADSNGGPPRNFSFPMLTQTAFGNNLENVRMSWGTDGQGSVEIAGLAPGEYTLEFSGQDGQLRGSSAPVDLTSDRVLDRSSVEAGAAGTEVDGTLTMAFGAKAPTDLNVALAPVNERSHARGQKVSDKGAFSFHDVVPGLYELIVTGGGRQLPVLHLRTAGRVIEGGRIQIGSEAVTLAADAAIGSVTMNGFVRRNGEGFSGAMVVLVPHNPKANPYLFRRDQSDSDGSFTLRGIVPGRYTVIAIDDGWELEWAREGVLQKYLKQGKQVEVKEGVAQLDLSESIDAQAR